jgi:hypothetical protein
MSKYSIDSLKIFNEEYIKPLSDPSYQERVWPKGIGPEVDSIDESMMSFFERCRAFIDFANDQEGLTDTHKEMLKKLYDKVYEYCLSSLKETNEDEIQRVLLDPKWHEIQNYSKTVYVQLKNIYTV